MEALHRTRLSVLVEAVWGWWFAWSAHAPSLLVSHGLDPPAASTHDTSTHSIITPRRQPLLHFMAMYFARATTLAPRAVRAPQNSPSCVSNLAMLRCYARQWLVRAGRTMNVEAITRRVPLPIERDPAPTSRAAPAPILLQTLSRSEHSLFRGTQHNRSAQPRPFVQWPWPRARSGGLCRGRKRGQLARKR